MDYDHIDTSNEMVKKIIKTSFEVFAKNDFKKASTNLIVQTAGISRGILYHYFKDKDQLFDYLKFYSFLKSFDEVDRYINWEDNDLIRRISDLTKYRLDVIAEYPFMIEFGEKYREEVMTSVDPSKLRGWRTKFYEHNIAYDKFKGELDMEQVIHVIKWTFRGLYKELLEKPDPNIVITESAILTLKEKCDDYSKLLEESFYS